MLSHPKVTLPTWNAPGAAYSCVVVSPTRIEEPSRRIGVQISSARERTILRIPEFSDCMQVTTFSKVFSVLDAVIRAAEASFRGTALIAVRRCPCWGGVAPVGQKPPRPAPPNPYGAGCGSAPAPPMMTGAASLPLPFPFPLPLPLSVSPLPPPLGGGL